MVELQFDVKRDEYQQFFLQARRGSTIVGNAEGYPDSPGVLFIKWLGVGSRYRRHGYGTEMVRELERLAQGWGYHSIALSVNDRRSAAFWEAMGYTWRQGDEPRRRLKRLEDLDLVPNSPAAGPPVPRELRVFWPGRPLEP